MAGALGGRSFRVFGVVVSLMMASVLFLEAAGNAVALEDTDNSSLTILLDERFNSWSELDGDWTFLNCSHDGFSNWFNVSDGRLHATNNGVLVLADYLSYANWTRDITYQGEFRLSFNIFLPMNYTDKIGWAGQVFYVILYDQSGSCGLWSRFVMDRIGDNPSPSGFVYSDEAGIIRQICTFEAGWHHVSYVLRSDNTTWSAEFDGVVYDNLQYSYPQVGPFDISKLTLINALREEVQNIYVDDLLVTVFESTEDGIDDPQDQIDDLQDQIDDLQDQIDGLRDQIDDSQDQIDSLQDQIDDLQDQIDDLRNQIDNPQDQDGDGATVAASWVESGWLPLGAVVILSVVILSVLLLNRGKGSRQNPPQ